MAGSQFELIEICKLQNFIWSNRYLSYSIFPIHLPESGFRIPKHKTQITSCRLTSLQMERKYFCYLIGILSVRCQDHSPAFEIHFSFVICKRITNAILKQISRKEFNFIATKIQNSILKLEPRTPTVNNTYKLKRKTKNLNLIPNLVCVLFIFLIRFT